MKKELDPFIAGWNAAQELLRHEWGPSPATTPEEAKKVWEVTCNAGHVVNVTNCKACAMMAVQGKRRTI